MWQAVEETIREAVVKVAEPVTAEPDPKNSEIYADRLETYRQIYPTFRKLRLD